jgi:hypothetical protein
VSGADALEARQNLARRCHVAVGLSTNWVAVGPGARVVQHYGQLGLNAQLHKRSPEATPRPVEHAVQRSARCMSLEVSLAFAAHSHVA